MTNKKSMPSNRIKDLGFLSGAINQFRLVWLLLKDKQVPLWTKLVIPISLIYLVSPIDVIPDVMLGLGQMDDLGIILLGMALFIKLCPSHLVDYYRNQLEYGLEDDSETVNTTYRVMDED